MYTIFEYTEFFLYSIQLSLLFFNYLGNFLNNGYSSLCLIGKLTYNIFYYTRR